MPLNTLSIFKRETKTVGISKEQFTEIFDKHYTAIKNFIYYKTGDIEVAEDLTQEAFIKVWERRSQIVIETVRPLLYTIAGNLFTNSYNHSKVKLKFSQQLTDTKTTVSPEYEMEVKEFDVRLQKALSDLSEKNREVFLMNRIDEMTYAEIATSLGLSVKAIEKRMKGALDQLRDIIDGH